MSRALTVWIQRGIGTAAGVVLFLLDLPARVDGAQTLSRWAAGLGTWIESHSWLLNVVVTLIVLIVVWSSDLYQLVFKRLGRSAKRSTDPPAVETPPLVASAQPFVASNVYVECCEARYSELDKSRYIDLPFFAINATGHTITTNGVTSRVQGHIVLGSRTLNRTPELIDGSIFTELYPGNRGQLYLRQYLHEDEAEEIRTARENLRGDSNDPRFHFRDVRMEVRTTNGEAHWIGFGTVPLSQSSTKRYRISKGCAVKSGGRIRREGELIDLDHESARELRDNIEPLRST